MWYKERVTCTHTLIYVRIHSEEAGTLQMQVGIDIHYRIAADFYLVIFRLQMELLNGRRVSRCIVFGKVSHISTQLHGKYLFS